MVEPDSDRARSFTDSGEIAEKSSGIDSDGADCMLKLNEDVLQNHQRERVEERVWWRRKKRVCCCAVRLSGSPSVAC